MNDLLIITSKAPYSSNSANDALDAALAASNVGLSVSVLFEGMGVFQLLCNQHKDETINQSIEKRINVLPMYDIDDLFYFSKDKLFSEADLLPIASPICHETMLDTIKAHKHVLRF